VAENAEFAFPIGACSATYTESASTAQFTGYVEPDDLLLKLEFGPLDASIDVCHFPHANGGTKDLGKPEDVQLKVPLGGGYAERDQIAHAVGLGDFNGRIFITVIPIHR